jgi:hypothetical protein
MRIKIGQKKKNVTIAEEIDFSLIAQEKYL